MLPARNAHSSSSLSSSIHGRMRDTVIARVRDLARDRAGALMKVGRPSDADAGSEDFECLDFPLLLLPDHIATVPACILVATDFSQSSLCAGRAALAIAPSTQVHLVHVSPYRWRPTGGARPPAPHPMEPFAVLFAAFEAMLHAPDARFTRAVLDGDPARSVLAHARSNGADLIAIGVHGHASVYEKPLGRVAERILREAPCQVLVAATEPAGTGGLAADVRLVV